MITRTLGEMRRARGTWVFLLLLLVTQALMSWANPELQWKCFEGLGLSRLGLIQGRVASPLTYALLHVGWGHILCNALILCLMGVRLESWLGAGKILFIWLGGSLAAAAFHLWLGGKATNLLVGASGVAMAMLLVFCTLSPQSRMFPLPVSARNLGHGILLSSLLLMLMNPDAGVPWLSQGGAFLVHHGLGDWFRIGHACHFGGAMFGLCYGCWLMRRPVTREELLARRAQNERFTP